MVLNSLGDWVVYGLGILVVIYGGAKLLPDIVVNCTLAQYRAYRKLRIGIQQIRKEHPLGKDEPKYLPAQPVNEAAAAAGQSLEAQAGTKPEKSRPLNYAPDSRRPTLATDEEALAAS